MLSASEAAEVPKSKQGSGGHGESATIPYQPLPPIFAAAISGILLDRLIGIPCAFWVAIAVAAWVAAWVCHRNRRSFAASLMLLAACCALFGFRHHDRWSRFAENDLGHYARTVAAPLALEGVVSELPKVLSKSESDSNPVFGSPDLSLFTLRAERLRDRDRWIAVTGNVSVVVSGIRDDLRTGDSIRLFGMLSKPIGPQNPGDFDSAAMLRSRRILCVVRTSSPGTIEVLQRGSWGPLRFLERIRVQGRANLEHNMNGETAPLAAAMLLGMREGVDEETTQSLVETGTIHILAISGLHIGLVAAAVALFLYCFGVSKRTTAVVLALSALTYLFLTDVRPPAIRATVLVCVMATALYSGRRSIGVNTLCATALVVLILNPTELFQFGAQLSFIATGAFFWVPSLKSFKQWTFRSKTNRAGEERQLSDIERFEEKHWLIVRWIKRFCRSTAELFLVSLTIWAVTIPLILERIHLLTPIALAVNPLLWFPLTAALLAGFATMIFGAVPFLGAGFGAIADASFKALFGMIAFFQHLGGHYWMPGPPPWWNLVFYTAFVLLTFLPLRRPSPRILVPLLAFWIFVGLAAGWLRDFDRFRNDRLTLDVFSVGHGNCNLITMPRNKAIVYDVGCISSPRRSADVLSRGLWRQGKTHIDAIVLSHPDFDHYNGMLRLMDRFSIGTVLVSPYMFKETSSSLEQLRTALHAKNIPVIEVGEGDDLSDLGLPDFVFLHPPKSGFEESGSSNAACLVLRFEHRGVGVLLTGDLDGRTTPPFLKRNAPACEIMTLPHHGGRSKLTEPLLDWAKPRCLLVSDGRFTHRDETLEDFRRRGYTVHSTFEEGFIEISIDRNGTSPTLSDRGR